MGCAALCIPHASNAIAPLGASRALISPKVITANARMGVDIAIVGLLRIQPLKAQRQRNVLDDIGEIAGVKGVPIVQRSLLYERLRKGTITTSPAGLV